MSHFARATRELLAAARRAKLSGREYDVLLTAVMLHYGKLWLQSPQLEGETGLKRRQIQLVLSALERKGAARVKYRGHRHDPWGWFRIEPAAGTAIESDRSTAIGSDRTSGANCDRIRSQSTFLVRDHTDPHPPQDARERAEPGVGGGDLDDRFGPLLELARRLWPTFVNAPQKVHEILELGPHAPLDVFVGYLRYEAATSDAKYPLAAAATVARWDSYRRRHRVSRTPEREAPVETGERVSAAEIIEAARRR